MSEQKPRRTRRSKVDPVKPVSDAVESQPNYSPMDDVDVDVSTQTEKEDILFVSFSGRNDGRFCIKNMRISGFSTIDSDTTLKSIESFIENDADLTDVQVINWKLLGS